MLSEASLGNHQSKRGLMDLISLRVLVDSIVRLNPTSLVANPVMLIVEFLFLVTSAMAIDPQIFHPISNPNMRTFYIEVSIVLFFTVWFSTLSDSLAETQAKMTASSLRTLESEVVSKKIVMEEGERKIHQISSSRLRREDIILLEKGDTIPIDCDVIEGIAMIDESLLTGESALVRKAPGDQIIGGSKIATDSLIAKVSVNPEDTYINQMIKLVETSKRPRTPNEQAITMVLIGLTAIFSIIIVGILGLSILLKLGVDLAVLVALYVCLLPTTIGALLPAIGLSGINRLYERKIISKSGKSIEVAGDTDTILLDKTGTITVGNRQAVEFIPFDGHTEKEVGDAAFLSSWYDDTPEGRSIIRLAHEKGFIPREMNALEEAEAYEFSATTRTSGVKIHSGPTFLLPKDGGNTEERGGRTRFRRKYADEALAEFVDYQVKPGESHSDVIEILKGAPDSIRKVAIAVPVDYDKVVEKVSVVGETPIAISKNRQIIGMVRLKDVLKPEIKDKITTVKAMGIRPVMITGDQPLTAKSIANEVGIENYVSRAKPEDKHHIVLGEQADSRIVAMIGDGTNDAAALAVADVGLAMNSGTEAAKEAANMVDMESNPAKIIDVVMLGKQLLMTRGAVTAFSITNDVAKYFAIVPVLFATVSQLQSLNLLHLGLQTAVLSALIFNAIVIPLLIPIALRGVSFKPMSTTALFLKNLLVYGLGGMIAPFIGIKLIDILLVTVFHV